MRTGKWLSDSLRMKPSNYPSERKGETRSWLEMVCLETWQKGPFKTWFKKKKKKKKRAEKEYKHLLPAQQHGGQICLSWGMGMFAFNSFEIGDRYCARNNLLTQVLFLLVNVWPRPRAKCVYFPNIISSHFFPRRWGNLEWGKELMCTGTQKVY